MSNYKVEWCGLIQTNRKVESIVEKPRKIIKQKPVQQLNQLEQSRLQSGEIDLLTYLDNISRDE